MRRKYLKYALIKLRERNIRWMLSEVLTFFLMPFSILSFRSLRGPLDIIFTPTYRCNLRCRMCNLWKHSPKKEMGFKEVCKLIDDVKSAGTNAISLTGGEILLKKDIFDIVKYAKKRGLTVNFSTNGSLVTKRIAEKIAEAGPDSVTISLDGAKEKTHEKIRGVKGSYAKTIRGIRYLNNACRNKNILIDIVTTISVINVEEVVDIVRLVKKLGIKSIGFIALHNIDPNEGLKKHTIKKDKIDRLFNKLFELKKEKDSIIDNSLEYLREMKRFLLGKDSKIPCGAGFFNPVIDPYWNIYPCYGYFMMNKPIGNLKNTEFKKFWFSPSYNKLRKNLFSCKLCIWNCQLEWNIMFKKFLMTRKFLGT